MIYFLFIYYAKICEDQSYYESSSGDQERCVDFYQL